MSQSKKTYEEQIHAVWWEGPFTPKKVQKLTKKKSRKLECWNLYKVYGSHPLYGKDVLLYIGMVHDLSTKTVRNVSKRLDEHDYWFDEQYFGESTIYFASIDKNEFNGWDDFVSTDRFSGAPRDLVAKIEALLIFAHQPAYNRKNRNSAENSRHIRIFNAGNKGLLNDEVSGQFHIGNPEHFIGDEGDTK